MRTTKSLSKNADGQSIIEQMHNEAREILSKKQAQIEEYNSAIEKAEEELTHLKADLKSLEPEAVQDEEEDVYDFSDEIEQLKMNQKEEIDQLIAKHDEELQQMRTQFQAKLKESEAWAEQHADTVALQKQAQLEELRRDLDTMRKETTQTAFSATQTRTQIHQQSRNASLQNSKRIQYLESQLSELSSISREEIRDVRAKIEECIAAAEIRQREHENEIKRYEKELSAREEKYNAHLAALADQHAKEKLRLEQAVQAANTKAQNMQAIMKQLEKHHDEQLQTTLKDIEKMKASIYQTKAREDQQLTQSRTYIAQLQSLQRECRQSEQEIGMVETEIRELQDENSRLKEELSRIDNAVYGATNQ